jgi:hypothetical protein
MRRVDARFNETRSCKNLHELREPKKINWWIKVCFAVRMRLVTVDVGVMNGNWNAMTRKRRRLEGGNRRRQANWSGETRAEMCGGADIWCAVLRTCDMQPRTYHSRIWVEAVCMVILYERSWEAARSTRAAGTCNDPTKKRRPRDSARLTARGPQLVVCPHLLPEQMAPPRTITALASRSHAASQFLVNHLIVFAAQGCKDELVLLCAFAVCCAAP